MTILMKICSKQDKRSGKNPEAALKAQLNHKKGIAYLVIQLDRQGQVKTMLQTRFLRLGTTLGRGNLSI